MGCDKNHISSQEASGQQILSHWHQRYPGKDESVWTIQRRLMGLRRSKVRFHFPLLKAVKAGSDLWPCLSYLCGLEAHSTCFPMSSMKNPQGPNQEAKFWCPPSSQTVPASSDLFSLATSFLSSRSVKLTRNFLGKLFHSQKVTVDPLRSWSTLRQLRHDRDFYKSGRT